MADKKITQYDAATSPADADLMEIVQDVATTPVNKKVTWTTLKSFLKTYFDTVYSAINNLLVTAAPGSDHNATGLTITLTAAANVAFGDVCYIDANGKAALIDADAIASMSGIVMAIASISADAAGTFMLQGVARDDTWNWTVGGLIYGTVTGTTGNTLSQTAPTGTDDVIQIVGVATHADRMYFNPQLIQIEHT